MNKENFMCVGVFLVFFSYLLFTLMLLAIMIVFYRESSNFEYVFFCSKIKSIKNIIEIMAFNYQIFNTFLPNGSIVGLSTNYYLLLNKTMKGNICHIIIGNAEFLIL